MYRHPPPAPGRAGPRSLEEDAMSETQVLSAASLSGAPMPHFYNPYDNMIWTQTGPYPQYMLTPSFPPRQDAFEQQAHQQQGFEQHTKDCPRSRRNSGYALHHRPAVEQFKDAYLNPGPPRVSYGNQISHDFNHQQMRPGHLAYLPKDYQNMVNTSFQQASPHQWSAEEEEMKYGPFSDGEADTLKKGNRSCRKSNRGRGSNGLITPHYATMSRVAQANNSRQSSVDQESCGSGGLKYTSQPQLNSHLLSDFIGQRAVAHFPANSEALTPLSLKTSITFPRKLPPPNSTTQQQRYPAEKQNWNSGKNGRIALHPGDRLRQLEGHPSSQNSQLAHPYPDLARRPLSYSQVPPPPNKRTTPLRYSMMHNPTIQYSGGPPMTRSLVQQPIQTSSDDNPHEYEHSRSSSGGDIPVGMANGQNTERMATPDGYASLPYDSTLPTTSRPLARERRKSARSGAVRVDLSFADKSIRRPGSAPDLVNNDEAR